MEHVLVVTGLTLKNLHCVSLLGNLERFFLFSRRAGQYFLRSRKLVGRRISFPILRLLIKTLLLVVTVVHFSRYFLCLVAPDREMWRMRLSPTNPATLINAGNHVLKTLRCPITPLYLNLQLFYYFFY